ncbi:RDD family protein [Streptomyces nondiastaticus]|uniref:RDD family protein n=1 Tax=Streptomyces TaxID=1883 RepID=UPI002675A5AD|nr:RDD family protein [Streptomyces sp. VNUA116]WKU46457.1 RDD family protein [Streptomyces sp. VNUA116]
MSSYFAARGFPPPGQPEPVFTPPPVAGRGRRYGGAVIDAAVAFAAGLVSGFVYLASLPVEDVPALSDPKLLLRIVAGLVAMSFLNQVILTLLTRRSIGKLFVGTCLTRTTDDKRPGPWRVFVRWITGIAYACTIAPLDILTAGYGLAPDDFTGVRIVLRPGLRQR